MLATCPLSGVLVAVKKEAVRDTPWPQSQLIFHVSICWDNISLPARKVERSGDCTMKGTMKSYEANYGEIQR